MHIPDGFLDTKTAITTGLFSATGLGVALRHAGRHVQSRQVPLIGLTAAFIFVAQMINFPVAGGTSGHLLGAALAAVLLGPSSAVIVMTCVLIIQALLFADGGLLALGANAFNMAIVAPVCAYGVYRFFRRMLPDVRGQVVSASIAAWCSTVAASVFCAGELALSGTAASNLVFPAMAGVHSLIGIGESAITMLVLAAIARTRPELLDDSGRRTPTNERKTILAYGIIIILGMLILIVPYASKMPDGLERVARSLGFEYKEEVRHAISTPLSGYKFPGFESAAAASIVAGVTGVVAVFGFSILLVRFLLPKPSAGSPSSSD